MAKWNEVKESNLADYTREQAKAKGRVFYRAWRDFQAKQVVKAIKKENKRLEQEKN